MKATAIALFAGLAFASGAHAADGKAVFDQICLACHGATGAGLPGVFPPLAHSDFFKKAAPQKLASIVTHGLTGEVTVNGQSYNNIMPPQTTLSDEEIAAVLNHVSTEYNKGKAVVTPDMVRKARATP